MLKLALTAIAISALTGTSVFAQQAPAQQQLSPNQVKTLAPAGIDPKTDALVEGDEARVRQAFMNMRLIAESEGATLRDAVRLVVYTTDMFRFRPIVNKVQTEFWGQGPYPPRTIIEVVRLNQDDIVEVEGTFYARLPALAAQEKEALFRQFIQWQARQKSGAR